jgi:dihydrodipicolinate synthase/N-acetylneuraminate lyase
MVQSALSGDFKKAAAEHLNLLKLHKSLFVEANPIPVKTVLAEMGLMEKELRLPLEYGTENTVRVARQLIKDFSLKA